MWVTLVQQRKSGGKNWREWNWLAYLHYLYIFIKLSTKHQTLRSTLIRHKTNLFVNVQNEAHYELIEFLSPRNVTWYICYEVGELTGNTSHIVPKKILYVPLLKCGEIQSNPGQERQDLCRKRQPICASLNQANAYYAISAEAKYIWNVQEQDTTKLLLRHVNIVISTGKRYRHWQWTELLYTIFYIEKKKTTCQQTLTF